MHTDSISPRRARASQLSRGWPLLLIVAIACQDSPEEARHSAQVALAAGEVRIDSSPELDLGDPDASGSAVFTNVIDVTRLSSGVIVVADRGSRSIRFFSPRGVRVREVGRKGEGPGEYGLLTWIKRCAPDTLYIWDARYSRMTVLDSAGAFVRQFALPGDSDAISCTDSSIFVVLGYPKGDGMYSEHSPPTTAELTAYSSDGSRLHAFGSVSFGVLRPLAARTTVAVTGDRVFVGPGDSASIRVMTLSGTPLTPIALGVAGRAVEPRHYSAAIENILLGIVDVKGRERPRQRLYTISAPTRLPAYRAIISDPTGAVWAVTSPFGEGETVLRGADSLGRSLGELRLPGELNVREIGRDYLLAIVENAGGEQRVLLYRLHR